MAYTEVVLTIATIEDHDGTPAVQTRVARVEFESMEAFEEWFDLGAESRSILNMEYLTANPEVNLPE